ncbi:MAG: PqqD family protein [Pseudomonadota bacterium]
MTQEALSFVAKPDVMDCDIGGDRALLDLQTNTYFTLNPTASEIWMALSERKSVDELVGVITEAFDVTEAQCRQDIEALLADMHAANIIETASGDT